MSSFPPCSKSCAWRYLFFLHCDLSVILTLFPGIHSKVHDAVRFASFRSSLVSVLAMSCSDKKTLRRSFGQSWGRRKWSPTVAVSWAIFVALLYYSSKPQPFPSRLGIKLPILLKIWRIFESNFWCGIFFLTVKVLNIDSATCWFRSFTHRGCVSHAFSGVLLQSSHTCLTGSKYSHEFY